MELRLYFLPDPQLPSQLHRFTALGRHQYLLPGKQVHVCINNLPRLLCDCCTATD